MGKRYFRLFLGVDADISENGGLPARRRGKAGKN